MEGQKELFVPLSDVIKKVIPTSSWNFVEFYMKFKTQFRDEESIITRIIE